MRRGILTAAAAVLVFAGSAGLPSSAGLVATARADEAPAKAELATTEDEALERLEGLVDVAFEEVPLQEAAEHLSNKTGVQILFNAPALDAEGVSPETPVSLAVRRVKASKAVDLVLRKVGGPGGAVVSYLEDGLLFITTRDDPRFREQDLVVRAYNCRDLLRLPEPLSPAAEAKASKSEGKSKKGAGSSEEGSAEHATPAEELVEALSSVGPEQWESAGGTWTIRVFNGLVTVRASAAAHQKIESLLQEMRDSAQDELAN